MARRFYNLPPLTALAAFEAAGRHLSFKDAAHELSVTPGAVSHQIKTLETDLGTDLFLRKHRGVELTKEGKAVFATLNGAFQNISGSLETIRNENTGGFVTVGSTSAVASLWLAPTVNSFWRTHPEVNVNQIIRDRGASQQERLDMFIRYGKHTSDRLDQIPLYRDNLVPIAQPERAKELAGQPLDVLAKQPLIHLDSEDKSWTSWRAWLEQLGYEGPISKGIRVNQDGVGLALGWKRLVKPFLKSNGLKTIDPHVLVAPHNFYLVSKPEADLSKPAKLLKNWIVDRNRDEQNED